jgi:hypothetical protein
MATVNFLALMLFSWHANGNQQFILGRKKMCAADV